VHEEEEIREKKQDARNKQRRTLAQKNRSSAFTDSLNMADAKLKTPAGALNQC